MLRRTHAKIQSVNVSGQPVLSPDKSLTVKERYPVNRSDSGD